MAAATTGRRTKQMIGMGTTPMNYPAGAKANEVLIEGCMAMVDSRAAC
jgi:hypothetical protein